MKVEALTELLDAEFTPGPNCEAFEPHGFQMRRCPPGDGLRARWFGRRWVIDPSGRDVLVWVNLLVILTGAVYLTVAHSEPGTVPFIVKLEGIDVERPAFTVGPANLLGNGSGVRLTVAPAE